MEKDEVKLGVKVEHDKWGYGITTQRTQCPADTTIMVRFIDDMVERPVLVADLEYI